VASRAFTPQMASVAYNHPRKPPSTTSTSPTLSPPKKAFPLEHSSIVRLLKRVEHGEDLRRRLHPYPRPSCH
jgi:hypothetical protein